MVDVGDAYSICMSEPKYLINFRKSESFQASSKGFRGGLTALQHLFLRYEPLSKQPNLKAHHLPTSSIGNLVSVLRLLISSKFFSASFLAAQIPFIRAAGIADELSDNIISDLGPIIALFGEQVAVQFMSQSMGIADNIIFAVAPLGIITAIVSAIRVGGPRSLRVIIGRARESRPTVEIELMSSTSADVSELWDGEGVVRALGKSPVIELIYVTPESLDGSRDSPLLNRWEDDCGIYDFDSARKQSSDKQLLEFRSSSHFDGPQSCSRSKASAPNISLNFGGKKVTGLELWSVAIFGIILQSGVIVYAVLTCAFWPWDLRLQKQGYRAIIHAFLMASGTVAQVTGMFLCSYIVERSTVEELWEIKKQAGVTVQVAWLQKGGMVNDQLFDSYAIFSTAPEEKASVAARTSGRLFWGFTGWLSKRGFGGHMSGIGGRRLLVLRFRFRVLLDWATAVALWVLGVLGWLPTELTNLLVACCPRLLKIGWVRRSFHPFRSLHLFFGSILCEDDYPSIRTSRQAEPSNQKIWAAIAALFSLLGFLAQFLGFRGLHWSVTVSQLVATVVMTILRAWVRRNLIHKPQYFKIESGYELERMARKIKGCQHWSVVTWGFDQLPFSGDFLAANVMTARRRLGVLSKWPSQWYSTINSTVEAIAASMNFLFSSADVTLNKDYWSTRGNFGWKMMVEVGVDSAGLHLEEITLTLKRSKQPDGHWGPWRVVKSEVEAVFGLWMLHLKDLEIQHKRSFDEEDGDWQRDEGDLLSGKPILRVLGPYDELERINYERWIARQTLCVKVDNIKSFTEGPNKQCDQVIGCSTRYTQSPCWE